jgi:hypothetical protein
MSRSNAPTTKQLALAKSLASQTGTTLTYPTTRAHASREIQRLLALTQGSGERHDLNPDDEPQLTYATGAQQGEVSGYGSTASWKGPIREVPAPTPKQLAYIDSLAKKTGANARTPETRRQASQEIERLLDLANSEQDDPAPEVPDPEPPLAARPREGHAPATASQILARYTAEDDDREIVSVPGQSGSTLLIDRIARAQTDARLVAQIQHDETPEAIQRLCEMYLADDSRGRCCLLAEANLNGAPPKPRHPCAQAQTPTDAEGRVYNLRKVDHDGMPELRWVCTSPEGGDEPLSLREVVGRLESYEPTRSITEQALAHPDSHRRSETRRLAEELASLLRSRIVLNRGLREAVLDAARNGVSLSELALRCGRAKHDDHGNISGETSWLARRIGQLPEGGHDHPSPWIHTDTLALITRAALDGYPIETEVAIDGHLE